MAVLLNAATTNTNRATATGTATGASRVLIEIPDDVVFGGAEVVIEASSVNTATKFTPVSNIGNLQSPGNLLLELPTGHFVRAVLNRVSATTSMTVNMLDVT
jgi:hypothetical protein